jgi:hypothetical protein
MSTIVKDNAAREAEDAARHGYNGRNGNGAQLLKACARAVRIAAGSVLRHGVPAVSADERAEYAADLVARIVGDHGGRVPEPDEVCPSYLAKRAQGLILNDPGRRELVSFTETSRQGRESGAPEPCIDSRLTGPLSIPPVVERLGDLLGLTETGRRALAVGMVPATRKEWAELWGYASPKSVHVTAHRGRAEIVALGEDTVRAALRQVEAENAAELAAVEGGEQR